MRQKFANVTRAPAVIVKNNNLWPGLTEETAQEFARIGRGQGVSNVNKYAQVHVRYYHQVAVTSPTSPTQLSFFNVGAQEHICNLNNGLAPDERPYWLTGICVAWQDLTAAGGAGQVNIGAGVATGGPFNQAEQVKKILEAGLLQLRVGDRQIFEAQDLTHFPSDGGFCVYSLQANQAAAANMISAPYNNGAPFAGNRFRFPAPYPILPGKAVGVQLKWQTGLNLTTTGRIRVELVGESILPLSV